MTADIGNVCIHLHKPSYFPVFKVDSSSVPQAEPALLSCNLCAKPFHDMTPLGNHVRANKDLRFHESTVHVIHIDAMRGEMSNGKVHCLHCDNISASVMSLNVHSAISHSEEQTEYTLPHGRRTFMMDHVTITLLRQSQ